MFNFKTVRNWDAIPEVKKAMKANTKPRVPFNILMTQQNRRIHVQKASECQFVHVESAPYNFNSLIYSPNIDPKRALTL